MSLASYPVSYSALDPALYLASYPVSYPVSYTASYPVSYPVSYTASDPASYPVSDPTSYPASDPISDPASYSSVLLYSLYLICLFIGGVMLWWASWNLMDKYIPNTELSNIMIFLLAIILILVVRFIYQKNWI